jgi:hypothetical protein
LLEAVPFEFHSCRGHPEEPRKEIDLIPGPGSTWAVLFSFLRTHLSRVSLQLEYSEPILVFLNKGLSCGGREEG